MFRLSLPLRERITAAAMFASRPTQAIAIIGTASMSTGSRSRSIDSIAIATLTPPRSSPFPSAARISARP